ncbi:MAG: agmatine deiminase family protein [Campylobacterota bacterium]|nr:agmatine deiminase family protein [Campylobacterota bacterium]
MTRLPAEWESQEFVQLVFPHKDTDWNRYLDDAIDTFVNIAKAIQKYQKVLIIAKDLAHVKSLFDKKKNLTFVRLDCNDTWSRDFGGITVDQDGKKFILDFKFNAWGKKFEFDKDNQITRKLKLKGLLKGYGHQSINFVLEGGAIESTGDGVLMTTSACMLEKNRNPRMKKKQIEQALMQFFGLKKVLWLDHGYLAGDDTDSHIDTLARFISNDTIVYQSCDDEDDEQYEELKKMEEQLGRFKTAAGKSFKLVPLPWIEPKYEGDDRLPATYANFLIINGAVLVPTYHDKNDNKALEVFKNIFPKMDIVAIDCTTLIKEHGSLHCVTMQYPKLSNSGFTSK